MFFNSLEVAIMRIGLFLPERTQNTNLNLIHEREIEKIKEHIKHYKINLIALPECYIEHNNLEELKNKTLKIAEKLHVETGVDIAIGAGLKEKVSKSKKQKTTEYLLVLSSGKEHWYQKHAYTYRSAIDNKDWENNWKNIYYALK